MIRTRGLSYTYATGGAAPGVISVFVPDRKVMEKSLFRTTT